MTGFLSARQIRIFDYPRFAEPLRDRVRDRAAELASAAGVTIEHTAKKHIRKEDIGGLRVWLPGKGTSTVPSSCRFQERCSSDQA